jgi:nicotinate-nucleotide adenylyltransferase
MSAAQQKKVGLFFGTFNPMHRAHLFLANHMVENLDLKEVWFVITPKSPFKQKDSLASNQDRYQMVYDAIESYPKFKAVDIEFSLPSPSYTADTLAHLEEKFNYTIDFSLIMGEDNLVYFHKWKNFQVLLERYRILVYPRVKVSNESADKQVEEHPNVFRITAPIIELSASYVREQLRLGHEVRPLLPDEVWSYIESKRLYL